MAETMGSVTWLLGQLFMIPLQTFFFGMERMLDAMRGIQNASGQGWQLIAGAPSAAAPPPQTLSGPPSASDFRQGAATGGQEIESKEMKPMDKDLNDDMLKLVRYKVLFVKREYEHAFDEEEDLVYDNIDSSAFTAWKIAEFIQKLQRHPVEVPASWKGYAGVGADYKLRSLPEGDKKYLRVYYEVLERYQREKLRYEEDHLDLLRKQTECLCALVEQKKSGSSSSGGSSTIVYSSGPATSGGSAPPE